MDINLSSIKQSRTSQTETPATVNHHIILAPIWQPAGAVQSTGESSLITAPHQTVEWHKIGYYGWYRLIQVERGNILSWLMTHEETEVDFEDQFYAPVGLNL